MDETYAYFFKKCGPVLNTVEVPQQSISKYEERLPARLLEYWKAYGWTQYSCGFWTVNPDDYAEILVSCLSGTPYENHDDYSVIARSAFGALFVWGKQSGIAMKISMPHAIIFPSHGDKKSVADGKEDLCIRVFFQLTSKDKCDFPDQNEKDLFDRALNKLGPLDYDEMYGFVPALPLGGQAKLENLRKVKALEHLLFLSQLDTFRCMENPYIQRT
jgi:hypothetical protein